MNLGYDFIFMFACSCLWIIGGIIGMIITKDKENFEYCFFIFLLGFTPAAGGLTVAALFFGFMGLIAATPNFLFNLFKQK